jgi:group I intron endonuclease
MEYEGIIYRYKSPSGKYYIGQTINEERRRGRFLYDKSYGGPKIDRARKKYGPENFEYTVLVKVTGDNQDEVKHYLDILEIEFIKMYDSVENGYNIVKGGGGCVGFNHSESTKEKISKSNKGNRMSDDARRKISEAKKGKPSGTKGKHWIVIEGKRVYTEKTQTTY